MAQTLLARLKGMLSSKNDDFFDEDDLLDYLNAAKMSVFGAALKLELANVEAGKRQIRALDNLRSEHAETGLTFTAVGSFYKTEFAVESDFNDLLYAGVDISGTPVALTEIGANRLNQLDWGIIKPTAYRGYFHFFSNAGVNTFRIYISTNDEVNTTVNIMYVNQPSAVVVLDEDLDDLPPRLINAVLLRAATLAATQESRENTPNYAELYKLEITENLW